MKKILAEYYETQELVRELQKQQKEMRDIIIRQMDKAVKSEGDYVAVLTEAERKSLDKKALLEDHGAEFVDEYTKLTVYQKLEIKKAA